MIARNRRAHRALAALTFVAALLAPSHVAGASDEVVVGQGSPFSFDFTVSPRALPRSEPAPARLGLFAEFASPTGSSHPPPISQVTVLLDRYLDLSARGLPSCDPGIQVITEQSLPELCKPALVGRGRMEVSIALVGAEELRRRPRTFIYSDGTSAGSTRLWVYAYLHDPVPSVLLARVDLTRIKDGRYGTEAVLSIPKIAGGAGSIVWISLSIHRQYAFKGKRRSVITARCQDGKLQLAAEASFADGTPPAPSSETVHPCVAAG